MAGGQTVIARLQTILGMDADGYVRGALNAQTANALLGQSITGFISNPLIGAIGIMKNAVGGFLSLSDQVLSTAESVAMLSAETGASTDLIQALRAAVEQAGGSAAGADAAFRTLIRGLGEVELGTRGGKLIADTLGKIGLEAKALGEGDAAFRKVIDALAQIDDRGARAAAATKLFGDAGATVAIVLEQQAGGADGLITRMRNLGQIIDSTSLPALARLEDASDTAKAALNGLGTQLVAEFLAGLAGADDAASSIEEISSQLQSELVPAMKRLGEETKAWLSDLSDVREVLHEILVQTGISQRTETEKNLKAFLEGAKADIIRQQNERDGYVQATGWAFGGGW